MHPDSRFRVEDRAVLLDFIAAHPFVTFAASVGGRPFVAQSPVVIRELDGEVALDFHLSRGNVLTPHLTQGFRAVALATGLEAYISPDWYESADQVPTWNYQSVEAEGSVAPLDDAELIAMLDDLSNQEEARLLPKTPWTRDKMKPASSRPCCAASRAAGCSSSGWREPSSFRRTRATPIAWARLRGWEIIRSRRSRADRIRPS